MGSKPGYTKEPLMGESQVTEMQIRHEDFKMGADLTWILITGVKQFLLMIDLYVFTS